jgi:hypothetical protein
LNYEKLSKPDYAIYTNLLDRLSEIEYYHPKAVVLKEAVVGEGDRDGAMPELWFATFAVPFFMVGKVDDEDLYKILEVFVELLRLKFKPRDSKFVERLDRFSGILDGAPEAPKIHFLRDLREQIEVVVTWTKEGVEESLWR